MVPVMMTGFSRDVPHSWLMALASEKPSSPSAIELSRPQAAQFWAAQIRSPPRILVVDDDEITRQTFGRALNLRGFRLTTVTSGAEAVQAARGDGFDLIFLDLNLGDMSGIDVLRAVHGVRNPRVVLISGFLTLGTAVEAMKLGAVDVMEKPIDLDELVSLACSVLAHRAPPPSQHDAVSVSTMDFVLQPRSAADRWAGYVIRGCIAKGDFKTLDCWARETGVGYTTLCTVCRIVRVRPLDARDFARVLRALCKASVHDSPPEVFLDVLDARTLRTLSIRAGVDLGTHVVSLTDFWAHQRFVSAGNEGLRIIRMALQDEHALDRLGASGFSAGRSSGL
jgi:two-component system, response regulator RegA